MKRNGADEGSQAFAALLFGLGTTAMVLSWQIPVAGLGMNHDPGPRAFPLALGLFLLGGAIYEFTRAWLSRKREASPAEVNGFGEEDFSRAGPGDLGAMGAPAGESPLNFWLFCGAMPGCLLLLPWFGFFPAIGLLAFLMMWRLGASWVLSAASTLVLLGVVYLLFVRLFKVPLPSGLLFD
jgi:hypothetical protein